MIGELPSPSTLPSSVWHSLDPPLNKAVEAGSGTSDSSSLFLLRRWK